MKRSRIGAGRKMALPVIAITAAGALLRFWEIGQKGLWLDEAFSIWLAWQPIGPMVAWVAQVDQHPPLYYLLLHFWIQLAGDTPASVRLLSALLGAATIPITFLVGRRLLGARPALIAAFILALSPFHVRFAQETRMYTLLALNASLALLALTHLLTDDPEARQAHTSLRVSLKWAGYVVFTAATMLSHNTAIFFPLAVNLFVLSLWLLPPTFHASRFTRLPLKSWLLAQLAVLLLWSPWLLPFVTQAAGVDREFWIPKPTWAAVWAVLKSFLSAMLPPLGGWAAVIWAGYGGLIALAIMRLRRQPALLALFAILFAAPIVGELLVSLRRPIFHDRTLIWATLPLYLLLAVGIAGLRRRPLILAGLVGVAAVNLISLRHYYVYFEKEEWGPAAAYVAARVEPDDLLLFNATWVQIPFNYYFRAYGLSVEQRGAPVDLFEAGVLEPKMTPADLPRLHALVAGRRRVWLIYSHDWYTDPRGLIPDALAQHVALLEQRRFVGLEVRLYAAPP